MPVNPVPDSSKRIWWTESSKRWEERGKDAPNTHQNKNIYSKEAYEGWTLSNSPPPGEKCGLTPGLKPIKLLQVQLGMKVTQPFKKNWWFVGRRKEILNKIFIRCTILSKFPKNGNILISTLFEFKWEKNIFLVPVYSLPTPIRSPSYVCIIVCKSSI